MITKAIKKEDANKTWYLIDAAGQPLGRVASEAATILRGKHKPCFTPNTDCGDYLVIINSDKAVLTGNKLTQKYFKRFSGFIDGLKEIQYKKMMAEHSDVALMRAVKGMLPKNTLGKLMLKHCMIYKGSEHTQQAQQPKIWTLKGDK